MYRYWDGHAWSAVTTSNPAAPPPSQGLGQSPPSPAGPQSYGSGQQYGQQGQQPRSGQNQYGQNQYGQNQYGGIPTQPTAYQAYRQQTTKRSGVGWWLGGAAVLVVLIIVAVLVIRNLGGGGGLTDPTGGGEGSANPCPTTTSSPPAHRNHPNDGRVHGGPISYPQLGQPWGPPQPDYRVPFGTDVQEQSITIEANYQPGQSWVASVLIAQLIAGDGFYTPKEGAAIVAKCVVGAFYGDNPVERHDEVSKAMKVDGHDAWYLRSHLTFDIEGLQAKGEVMTVVVINAGATSGLYYASIPDNAKQWQGPADQALEGLTVDK
jgi:hypothetical protein